MKSHFQCSCDLWYKWLLPEFIPSSSGALCTQGLLESPSAYISAGIKHLKIHFPTRGQMPPWCLITTMAEKVGNGSQNK